MLAASLALSLSSCGPRGAAPASLEGTWRAVLLSPGGELPFGLEIAAPGGPVPAWARNGEERVPFSTLTLIGDRVTLRMDGYDSEIEARLEPGSGRMRGTWSRTILDGVTVMPFSAARGDPRRFGEEPPLPGSATAASVDGTWRTIFTDEDTSYPARGEFRQVGSRVRGTFLTPEGDYRFLEGDLHAGRLRLSCFDGSHAFLFRAVLRADGSLQGEFWSRNSYHATWVGHRLASGEPDPLPDPFRAVSASRPDARFRFRFPDLMGREVSSDDSRFTGKVTVVNLFGSWCANCNDEAPLLAEWSRRYADRGLEVVGLAFELTGDPERDGAFVARYAQRHGIHYPLLLAGRADKAEAAAAVPDLTGIEAFPTTVFVGRDRRIRRVHSGFAGPGTGPHHDALVAEMEALLEALLAEPAPAVPPG